MSDVVKPASSGLLRANVIVALGTFLCRITGFMRVLTLASVFGFSGLSDVYNTANTTPNIIYELMMGGILSATLLPVFVRQLADKDARGMSAVISVIVVALAVLTVVMVAAAPFIISLYAVNRGDDVVLFTRVGSLLATLFMPQIFFYGLMSLMTSLLNARRAFALPAYAPILNNVVVVAVLLTVARIYPGALDLTSAAAHPWMIVWLGLGTTAGIAASALVMLPRFFKRVLPLGFVLDWKHPSVTKVLKLSGWTIGYVAANQAALFIITTLALGHVGWLSAYQTAYMFFLLPHGLFAVSIMSTLSPDLARAAHDDDMAALRARVIQGVRILALLMLPASAGYVLIAHPLVETFLHHGRFDAADSALTSGTLSMFALGLFPFSVYLFLLRSFYALEDTRSVFYLNLFENVMNIALAIPLLSFFGVKGLALSYALAYLLAALLTAYRLGVRIGGVHWLEVGRGLLPMVGSVLAMAVFVLLALFVTDGWNEAVRLAVVIAVGGLVYGVGCLMFRLPELRILREKLPI